MSRVGSNNTGALIIKYIGDTRDVAKSNKTVERQMGKFKSSMAKANQAANAGLIAGGAAAVKFGIDSVKAYSEAETAQNKLASAYKKFPKMADLPLSKLKELNSTLAKKTKFDDDATASGQAVLAQFGLTGKQIAKLTPLLQDYAARTGKDLPTAAKDLGKSIMGQGRALKNIGLNFQDAGSKAGNLRQLMGGLREKVGGFASKEGKTAAGRAEILRNQFGELQETVGGALMPTLQRLVGVLLTVVGWIDRNRGATLAIGGALVGLMVTVKAITFGMKAWAAVTKICNALLIGTRLQLIGLAVVQKTVAVATKIGAAAQWLFNAALRANPIGIVITAVTALVAGLVWFFTKTKVGQRIVRTAWAGIKAAIKGVSDWWTGTAWPAIKKGATAVGNAFRSLGRWTRSVWNSIGDAIGRAWRWVDRNVLRPFKLGLRILGLAFRIAGVLIGRVWRAAVGKVLDGWRWVDRNVFRPFKLGLRILGLAFRAGREVMASVWSKLVAKLRSGWQWVDRKVFDPFRRGIASIKRAFSSARDGIARTWDGIKKASMVPVRFVVNTVWNNGLRKMINAIPGVGDIAPTKLAFRQGGAVFGPGTSTSDSINARLSRNEHVWTAAEVRAIGGHKQMERMRRAALSGKLYGGDPKFAKGGGITSAAISRAQAFARQQQGKPYGWGSVGPSSYDCSGFMSALTNVLRGQSPHRRVGSTASFPWAGFERGPGQFTIGSSKNFSGGIGHMAGNLAGMGVESRGGRGVIVGNGAMSPSAFSSMYHLGSSGPLGKGGVDIGAIIKRVMDVVRKLPGQIQEMLSSGSWIGGLLKKMAGSLWRNIATWINKKIPDLGPFKTNPVPTKFASGGFVKRRPGGVHAVIGEGRYDEVVAQIRPGGGGGGGTIVIPVYLGGKVIETFVVDTVRKTVKTKGGGNVQKALGRGAG